MRNHLKIFFLLVFLPTVANAFVSSETQPGGPDLIWSTHALTFKLNDQGTADISDSQEFDVLRASFLVWQNVTLAPADKTSCGNLVGKTDLTFADLGLTSDRAPGYDNKNIANNENLLVFYDTDWPHSASGAIAITTTSYNSKGTILDADIEFNSTNFNFVASNPSAIETDLQNAAVHEIGHFIGLAHSPIPGTTMFASADRGDTSKRVLHCDDAQGLISKYPKNGNNDEDEDSGGCQQMPSTWFSLLGVLWILKRRLTCLR